MKYQPMNFNLTVKQIKKIQIAKSKNLSVKININKEQFNIGEHTLFLTKSQYNKLSNMKRKRISLTLSKTQMKHQSGGWLSAILPIVKSILPTVGKVLGSIGLAGATGAVSGLAEKATKGGCIEGISVLIPKNDVETIIRMISEFENKKIVPSGLTEMTKNGIQQQNGGFIAPLLGVLASVAAPLLAKVFTGNGVYKAKQKQTAKAKDKKSTRGKAQKAKGLHRAGSQKANGLYRAKGVFKKRKF
jgi:hypothetical protein